MITFRAVAKTYPDGTHAVSGIDLTIPAGKLTVFVGPSGCGKTTCLRMINRMVEPTAGSIEIDGVDVRSRHPAELRRGIGYVIQNVGLFPHRTVLDNIATVPMLTGARRTEARSAALALLERVGLPASVAHRYPAQLSGGQQQRVGVARALAADPPILLMDEPFSAVDPVVRAQLQDEMVRIQRELGTTVVFVTHDIDEALHLGDLIVVFAPGGRIAQVAEPATLLAAPADDFVADFIGHDRGYRALSFADAGALPTGPAATVSADAVFAAVDGGGVGSGHGEYDAALAGRPAASRWALLLDDDRRPQGWLDRSGIQAGRAPSRNDIRLGGTLIRPGGSLRSALDATLSSPSGSGVAVDDDGRLIGIVSAQEVLAAIERARLAATARDAADPVVGYADADDASDGIADSTVTSAGGAPSIPSGAP
jgi:osmoprotectant transport system ATP-binding protein